MIGDSGQRWNRRLEKKWHQEAVKAAKDCHDFCRATLQAARQEAKASSIVLPKHITALNTGITGRGQWFIEADEVRGEMYYGDCAFEAKTKYIRDIIDGKLKLQTQVERSSAGDL
jgi:hypothetical protein